MQEHPGHRLLFPPIPWALRSKDFLSHSILGPSLAWILGKNKDLTYLPLPNCWFGWYLSRSLVSWAAISFPSSVNPHVSTMGRQPLEQWTSTMPAGGDSGLVDQNLDFILWSSCWNWTETTWPCPWLEHRNSCCPGKYHGTLPPRDVVVKIITKFLSTDYLLHTLCTTLLVAFTVWHLCMASPNYKGSLWVPLNCDILWLSFLMLARKWYWSSSCHWVAAHGWHLSQ
jgi:hypothetical protein